MSQGAVYASTDSGDNWQLAGQLNASIGSIPLTVEIWRLIVDPRDGNNVFAGTSAGVFKSRDQGRSWTQLTNVGQRGIQPALTMNPLNPLVLYASSYASNFIDPVILKTTDGGTTWSTLAAPNCPAILSIGIDLANSLILYAGTEGAGLFRSADGGRSWVQANLGAAFVWAYDEIVGGPDPRRVLVSTDAGLFASADRGLTWKSIGPPPGVAGLAGLRFLAADPIRGGTLYIGRWDGVYKSEDSGARWRPINVGLSTTTILALAEDPFNPGVMYAGGSGDLNYFYESTDGGRSWTGKGQTGEGYPLVADREHDGVWYAGSLWKSVDHLASWTFLDLIGGDGRYRPAVSSVAIDPRDSQVLLAGSHCNPDPHYFSLCGLYKTTDGGDTWSGLSGGDYGCLEFTPDGSALYACTGPGYPGPMLQKSEDAGDTWHPTSLTELIQAIKVDPNNPSTLYAGSASSGVFKSTDGGGTWRPMSQGLTSLQIRAILIDASEFGRIFVATSDGVFESLNGGLGWHPLNGGLLDRNVWSLALDRDGTLFAGTQALGVFVFSFPPQRRIILPKQRRPPAGRLESRDP